MEEEARLILAQAVTSDEESSPPGQALAEDEIRPLGCVIQRCSVEIPGPVLEFGEASEAPAWKKRLG